MAELAEQAQARAVSNYDQGRMRPLTFCALALMVLAGCAHAALEEDGSSSAAAPSHSETAADDGAAFDPSRLLSPDGEVIATEGDTVELGGGFTDEPGWDRCLISDAAWVAASEVSKAIATKGHSR